MKIRLRYIVLLILAIMAGNSAWIGADSSNRFGDETSSIQYPRDRSYDIRHMVLDLSFDWDRQWVGGDVTFTLTPLAKPLRRVELDSADLTIWQVREGVEETLPHRVSGHRLEVDLGREVAPGELVTFTVSYESRPPKGLYFVGPDREHPDRPKQIWSQGEAEDSHWWFPCYDYPNDRMTFETHLTVPAGMTAVSNGRLVETRQNRSAGTTTFHYRQETPVVSYLVSVAIGEFEKYQDEYEGIPLEYFVPEGTSEETALRSFQPTMDMMDFFSKRIGVPYPYAKYAQVTVNGFLYGGMENAGATTLTDETLHPARVEPQASSLGLVAHELAHQWWGDLVTTRDWSHAWLNEGFATYFGTLYRRHRFGREEFQYQMLKEARDYFKEDREKYRRPIVQDFYTDPFDLFDKHLYPKGAWTLHMLRGVVGEELFWKVIQRYVKRHREGNVTTEDLRKVFEEVTGRALVWFFEEWYHRGGHPEFRLEQEYDSDTRMLRLRVEQIQTEDDLTPIFRMPVRVDFHVNSGVRSFHVKLSKADQEFQFPLADPPRMTRFDAGQWILKTLEFDRSLDELQYQLANDPDVIGRSWAAEQLGKRKGEARAASVLIDSLETEPFWGVRKEIAKALGGHRGKDSRTALIAAIGDLDTRVRSEALIGLGNFTDDDRALEAIRAAFQSESNDYVRAAAVKAYALTGAADAYLFVKRAASQESHREVIAKAACDGMAELGDPRAVPVLQEAARYGSPMRRREAAIKALGKLARGDQKKEVVEYLLDLLDDPEFFPRREAIRALGEAGGQDSLPALRDAARNEFDSRLRLAARRSMARIGDAGSGAKELKTLQDRIQQLEAETESLREMLEAGWEPDAAGSEGS